MEKKCCSVCGGEAPHRCSGCKAVHYCTKEHQKVHWKVHKLDCSLAYKQETSTRFGEQLVAGRNLTPGTIILKEEPIFIGLQAQAGPPVCLGCSRDVGIQAVKCPTCKWPMCGRKQCWEEGSQHAIGECKKFKEAGVAETYAKWVPNEVYDAILILRYLAVLNPQDGTKWIQLHQLKSYGLPIRRTHADFNDDDFDESAQIAAIQELVHLWIPGSGIPSEAISQFCGKFNANSFKLPNTFDNEAKGLRAVYYLASKIGHSCIPNAVKTVSTDGTITVRATVPIAKGARITFNHAGPLWGTMKRRFELTQTKFGSCDCERCSDPTELGTFASGIFCRKCPNQEGVLISMNPLDEMSNWTCNNCSDQKTIEFVANLLDKVASQWGRLNRFSIAECEAFVRKYGMILHPNHYYMTDIKVCLCTNYGHVDNTNHMDEKILDKKEAFVTELLKVADVVSPGLSRLRGILRYHLYAVHDYRFMKLVNNASIPPDELGSQLRKIHEILKEVITINSWEPEETVKGNLAKQLKQKLKNDECFLAGLELKIMMNNVLKM